MQNISCGNEFYLHENRKSFSYQWLQTYPCFETEGWGQYICYSIKVALAIGHWAFGHRELIAMIC